MIGDNKVQIVSPKAPAALGPYSQGIKVDDFIFLSGSLPVDPNTNQVVEGGIEEQTKQVFINISNTLDVVGSGLFQIVKTTVYLQSLDDFEKMNATYKEFFPVVPPARTTVEVSRLPKDALLEVDCIVYSPKFKSTPMSTNSPTFL